MKKIKTLFVRDENDKSRVTDVVTLGLEWVMDGHCVAREKLDGTACAIFKGRLYKRYTAREPYQGSGFLPSSPRDEEIGKRVGWVLIGDAKEDQWHREAPEDGMVDGTYELLGPNVQGNPYGHVRHVLESHKDTTDFSLAFGSTSFSDLKAYLSEMLIEGLVFWGPEGPVAKIKRRDFGFPWPIKD